MRSPHTDQSRSLQVTKRILALFALCAGAACSPENPRADSASGSMTTSSGVALTGAGATFPYPLYSKWFSEYAKKTGVSINYQSLGSGAGIKQLSEGTVD